MASYESSSKTLFEDVEYEIAHNVPFGDVSYLNNCTYSRYVHRLSMLAEHMPMAGRAAEALEQANTSSKYAIVGDPVVRSSINHALAYFRMSDHRGPVDTSILPIITLAEKCLRDNSTVPPLQMGRTSAARLGSFPYHGWIWTNKGSDNAATQHLHQLFERHLASDGLKLIEPGSDVIDNLRRGTELLGELLPELSSSALNHTHLVAIVAQRGAFISVTNPFIPGVIFLSESAASSPWEAADNLLHESLHAKFLDIEHTHAIMAPGYKPTDCLVRPPWRRPMSTATYLWPLTRLFTVIHVYLALAVFFSTVSEKSAALAEQYGPASVSNPARTVRQSLDRAEYLLQQVSLNSQHLGPAGLAFSQWLTKIAEKLDPTPRPAGAYLHLLADLYQQEANFLAPSIARLTPAEVRSTMNTGVLGFSGNSSLGEIILEMLQREISSVKQLAERSGSNLPWTTVLSENLKGGQPLLPEFLAASLWSVRALICQSLLQMQPSRFTSLNEPMLLEDMLLNSSRHVEATLGSVQAR